MIYFVADFRCCPCSFIKDLVFEVLKGMLRGVEGDSDNIRYMNMFSQWLKPEPSVTAGNPDETYYIVEGLLTVCYPDQTDASRQGASPWQRSDIDAVGSMKVIRVTDVRTGGRHFMAMLTTFLAATERPNSGPAWSGMTSNSQSHSGRLARWSLFAVIKDFSQDETSKKLEQNVPAWFRSRRLCSSHPALKSPAEVTCCPS